MSEPSGPSIAVKRRQEARLDGAAEQTAIEPREQRRGALLIRRLGAEHAEHGRRQQRGRRSLAGHVAEDEPELPGREIDVVEEVAANGPARHRGARDRKEVAGSAGGRQQRLLNGRGDLQLLLELRSLDRFTVQPRVFDRDRRFRAERLERRPRRRRPQRAALAAVEIQHADDFVGAPLIGALHVAHQAQRRAQHVADAERHGAGVQLRQIAVEQILDDRLLAGGEHGFGNLAARLERAARQRDLAARARELELELPCGLASMMKPRSAPVTSMAESSTSVSTSSSTRPDPSARSPSEQAGHVPDLAGCRDRAALLRRRFVAEEEDDFRVVGLAQADAIAMHERVLGGPLAVDERAEARLAVAQAAHAVLGDDFGVQAGHARALHADVGLAAAAERQRRLVDRDHPLTEGVGDQQPRSVGGVRVRVAHTGFALSKPICTNRPVKS